ncbi:MAG: hypothetical protein ACOX2G_03150 [Bacillota bacterium]|jgi:hypothetical protein
MLRLDFLGILLSLFLLGPRQWRWSLAAAGVSLLATLLTIIVLRVDLAVYTMGGVFTQVDLGNGRLVTLLIGLAGPFACYSIARLKKRRPMGEKGWLRQILPWSPLENPMEGTFAKYALLTAVFSIIKIL